MPNLVSQGFTSLPFSLECIAFLQVSLSSSKHNFICTILHHISYEMNLQENLSLLIIIKISHTKDHRESEYINVNACFEYFSLCLIKLRHGKCNVLVTKFLRTTHAYHSMELFLHHNFSSSL